MVKGWIAGTVSAQGAPADPIPVTVWAYKDVEGMTDPTTSADFYTLNSLNGSVWRKNTIFYRQYLLSTQGDKVHYKFGIPRRLRYIGDGESVKLIVFNDEAATDIVEHIVNGRLNAYQ